ncbi:MAG: DNA helicase RecQ [Chloroflexi bacterium]|nr:DNA helicase RecQ [Chloroflexota bacterium]
MASTPSALSILKSHFGYDRFRPLQEEIIDQVLGGGDALALMPTGGGKSLCYQLPAMCLPGLTLVISPLIALMKDQVDALNANGISARYVNSTMTASEIEQVQAEAGRGQVKILYAAPERLAIGSFRRFLNAIDLSLIAIDEAHCISEWGHEFRPDYRNLRQLRAEFPQVPAIALTATATGQVREDIIEQLGLRRGRVFLSSFNRENLSYSVEVKEGYWSKLLPLLKAHRGESAIIYCLSRRETEEMVEDLNDRGFSALPYHAGLESDVRRRNQEDFIRDRTPIIVATIAFGMGIDKPDIRLVVHHSLPKSLEGYYQETGRAGRDGLPSECVLFYSYADRARQEYFIDQLEDPGEQANARQKLSRMIEYAELPVCRRKTVLGYFGESWQVDNCGGCDVCLSTESEFDATELAQKILSAVIRTGERFGAMHVIKVLRGSREKRVLELGHDRLSVYGLVTNMSDSELREVVAHLRARGLLERKESEFAVLSVSEAGRRFLRDRESLALPALKNATASQPGRKSRPGNSPVEDFDRALFEELRLLRRTLADSQELPAYVVFGDTSLRQMAALMPQSMDSFAMIPGVGRAKLEEYGESFVAAISAYAKPKNLPDRSPELSEKRITREPGEARPALAEGGARRGTTYRQTREMLDRGMTISQIAEARNLASNTVIGHVERLAAQHEPLNLEHLLPDQVRLAQIKEAFDTCGYDFLKPAWEYLGSAFTYDELRLARIFLRQEASTD